MTEPKPKSGFRKLKKTVRGGGENLHSLHGMAVNVFPSSHLASLPSSQMSRAFSLSRTSSTSGTGSVGASARDGPLTGRAESMHSAVETASLLGDTDCGESHEPVDPPSTLTLMRTDTQDSGVVGSAAAPLQPQQLEELDRLRQENARLQVYGCVMAVSQAFCNSTSVHSLLST